MITIWLSRWHREMKESRAHKIRGKTHQNKFPSNIVIWTEAVVKNLWSTTSGVHSKKKEVTTSWTRTPMNSTTGPTT